MGQKVNPNGLRVGVIKNWDSRWFAKDNVFGDLLVEDYEIRKDLKKRLYDAGVPAIEIERKNDEIKIMIQCARPGMVVGRGGEDIKKLEDELTKKYGKKVRCSIIEIKGIKVSCGGRLGGAEIARTEHYHEGTIPLQTLRADIDYGFAEAATTYGRIGVKVWIYKGEVLHGGPRLGRSIEAPKPAFERRERRGGRDDRRGGRRDFNRGERRAPRQEGGNR